MYDNKRATVIDFMLHFLGLGMVEPWSLAVGREFDEFMREHNDLSALQVRFLQILRGFVVQRGQVGRGDLTEAPFTNLHPRGALGVFDRTLLDEVLGLAERVSSEAV